MDVGQSFFFDENQLPPGPGSLLAGVADTEDGVQDGVDAKLCVHTEFQVHFIHDKVPYGMGGIFTQKVSGNAGVQFLVVGHVVGEAPGGVLEPSFGRADGAHVRVVLGKPHLVVHRAGPAAAGNQSGHLQVFFGNHVKGTVL